MVTHSDLKMIKDINEKIDTLVKSYYEKFICGDETYRLCKWYIVDDNTIRIVYSYEDYLGYNESNYEDVSLDDLNKIDCDETMMCECGGIFEYVDAFLSLPPQYQYRCNKCGKRIIKE